MRPRAALAAALLPALTAGPAPATAERLVTSISRHQVQVTDLQFEFRAGETFHTENSHKYPQALMETLLQQAGWSVVRLWLDEVESGFGVYLLRASS